MTTPPATNPTTPSGAAPTGTTTSGAETIGTKPSGAGSTSAARAGADQRVRFRLIRGELTRIAAVRLHRWAALAAVVCGGGLTGLLSVIGPENATPPMPGIDTPEGAALVVGITGVLLFVPALIGAIGIAGEYRHRTIATTFLAEPRRGRVLTAKLVVYAALGLAYGVIASLTSAIALLAAAAVRGVDLTIPAGDLITLLIRLAVAAAAYTILGVAIGALAGHQLVAVGIIVGYFYFLEYILLVVPGINTIYPYLPGGATAALTDFSFITSTIAEQTAAPGPGLLPAAAGAAVLLAYAAAAATTAALLPLRRDIT
ncbi:ABC transporter permease subunit [Kribbella solani]|uniref:ABC transporter permease subunit n=1 Tax=Kribbella solani TaxID=236067 RepID=UPI0029A9E45A|nr:ABC transporter permease subunit [Kribbella solani]MDX2971956.1 ABC transporter permease subunit [Kribbella solani]